MNKPLIFTIMIIAFSACAPKQTNPEKWSDEEVNHWFNKQEWLGGWKVQPDASVNKRSLAVHYHKNPRHWDQAFHFLKTANLKELPPGKQELEGEHLFVSVAEYMPKAREETRYESHKKYIDIQYVIEGAELMGITTTDKAQVADPYNEANDIVFYNAEDGEYRKATPDNFLIFFPEDLHRPSVTTGDSAMVRKIVVKILMDRD